MTPYAMMIEKTFNIVDKSGAKVPFRLNAVQTRYDQERKSRNVIVKARQEGFSSFICADNTMACLAEKNIRCVLIAHDSESTEKLFDRVRFFLTYPQIPLSPVLTRSSRREFYFKENNSSFYIGTAGSENFGRGDTINRLHCCIAEGTFVSAAYPRRIESFQVGDRVITHTGKPAEVSYKSTQIKDCIEVSIRSVPPLV